MFLFGSAILHANNPLKNVSSEFALLCKKTAPLHFIQATPPHVLFALIGNFANKLHALVLQFRIQLQKVTLNLGQRENTTLHESDCSFRLFTNS